MVIEAIGGLVLGIFLREWTRAIGSMFRKKEKPAPKPERDIGDVVMDIRGGNLPIVLIEKLSYGKFRGCYITPKASQLGAYSGKKENETYRAVQELEILQITGLESRANWPDYPHKLSDGEHANYAKAMLTEGK